MARRMFIRFLIRRDKDRYAAGALSGPFERVDLVDWALAGDAKEVAKFNRDTEQWYCVDGMAYDAFSVITG